MSENVAYNLTSVMKAVRIAPELKTQIKDGTITLSNARTISSVITKENKNEWLNKAATLSQRALDKEITKINPRAATPEKVKYTAPDRVKLELGLSESEILRLRKMQNLVSQKLQRSASLEETLKVMMDDFEKRHDPVVKAKRQIARTNPTEKVRAVALQEPLRQSEAPPEIAE